MRKFLSSRPDGGTSKALDLARVLIVHGDLASRLALQTILRAGGYWVDVAATPAEALGKLDEGQFELVLSDSLGSDATGRGLLAYARIKDYRPATALLTSSTRHSNRRSRGPHRVSIYTE